MSVEMVSSSSSPPSSDISVNCTTEIKQIIETDGSPPATPDQNGDNNSTSASDIPPKPKKYSMWKVVNDAMLKQRISGSKSVHEDILDDKLHSPAHSKAKKNKTADLLSYAVAKTKISKAKKTIKDLVNFFIAERKVSRPIVVDENDSLRKVLRLHKNATFKSSSVFQEFEAHYNGLSTALKLCLLCFSVFPENAIIKKRLMVYWWIGEGFVPHVSSAEDEVPNGKSAEDFANEYFFKLMEKGFIEPVYKKKCPTHMVGRCKMHPLNRFALIMLAESANFFDFDANGNPTENFTSSCRACLVGKGLTNTHDLGKLYKLFNLSEDILELRPEWFSKMRNINFLYLGNWQASNTRHIEVDDTNFLNGLEHLNHLRLLSLQGVSGIKELPRSISKLRNLTILDIRACHNLEVLPRQIGSLKSLTHLDMSECYLLDRMPKELSLLLELRVLKGFVLGSLNRRSLCSLEDLAKLPKLRKLCMYTDLQEFPTETDLKALERFKGLCKLTITWGDGDSQVKSNSTWSSKPSSVVEDSIFQSRGAQDLRRVPSLVRGPLRRTEAFKQSTFGSQLEKLDLQCFPRKTIPNWLTPASLQGLKRLYIRGGKFSDLGQYQDLADISEGKQKWTTVAVLRLKYLNELEMDWKNLQELFPSLIYLEKVKCPKLTFFPCDETGVWMS